MGGLLLLFYSLLVEAASDATCNAGGSLIPILEYVDENLNPGDNFSIKLLLTNNCFKVEGGQHHGLPAKLPAGTPLCIKIVNVDEGGGGLGDVLSNGQVSFLRCVDGRGVQRACCPTCSLSGDHVMGHSDDLSEYDAWCSGCVEKAACGIIELSEDVEMEAHSDEILDLSIEAQYITDNFHESQDPAGCSELRAYVQSTTSPTALQVVNYDGSCSGEVGGGQGSSSLRVSCPTSTATSSTTSTSTTSTSTMSTSTTTTSETSRTETSRTETSSTFSCHICCEEILHYFEITRVMAASMSMAVNYPWEPLYAEPEAACLAQATSDGSMTEGGSTSDGSTTTTTSTSSTSSISSASSSTSSSSTAGATSDISVGPATEGNDVTRAEIMGAGFAWFILSVAASVFVTLAIVTKCRIGRLQHELVRCQLRLEQLESEEKVRTELAKQIERENSDRLNLLTDAVTQLCNTLDNKTRRKYRLLPQCNTLDDPLPEGEASSLEDVFFSASS